mgnify:FL=1
MQAAPIGVTSHTTPLPAGEGTGGGAGWLLFYLTPPNTQIDYYTD